MKFLERVSEYSRQYHNLMANPEMAEKRRMPGEAYFIEDHHILTMPREDGESRYPFGKGGFNFWAYASGYMHSNEGLFSPYLRAAEGQEPKIGFFTGFENNKGTYDVIPILSVPVTNTSLEAIRYTVFSSSSVYYISQVNEVTFAVRIFVDEKKKMYTSFLIQNHSEETKKLFVSSYFNPFLKNAVMEGAENRWFRQGSVIPKANGQNLDSFLLEVYEERDRGLMAPNYGIFTRNIELSLASKLIKAEETTSRSAYVGGSKSSLHTPRGLYKGTFDNAKKVTTFTEIAVAADLIHLDIGTSGWARIDIQMGYCFTQEEKEKLINEVPSGRKIDQYEEGLIEQEKQLQSRLATSFGQSLSDNLKEQVFESFFEHLKKQVEFCSLIKGYIQLSNFSLIGIRDVFQALEGLMYWQPEVAKEKMLEALNFVAPNGRCPRQYSLPTYEGESPNMDLRPFIDQGVWVISTISTYLRLTHDFKFLEQMCGYYEILDDKTHQAVQSERTSTVLAHMFDIMDYLLSNRDHERTQCVCALYGDWNDALDGLGVTKRPGKEYGTGVSVMATLQVYQNCKEMIDLLYVLGQEKFKEKIESYKKAMGEIKEGLEKFAVIKNNEGEKRIVHGWGDDYSYLVGSFNDPDGKARDGITSNAFWVLSGLYEETQGLKDTILSAFTRLDSKYGLKTFEPAFEMGTAGVGRIPNLPAGTAENGAAYIHASAFGVMALFKMGEGQLAWKQLEKILPFTHEKVSVSPYVMPNSYGYNEEKQIDGESMQDWQTGSSNVVFKALMRFVFGIEPEYCGIWIAPARYMPFQSFSITTYVQDTELFIEYEKAHRESERVFIVDGKEYKGVYDPVMKLKKLWLGSEQMKERRRLHIRVIG